ncbi:hypothetical protein M407DRAFT_243290, partial [Tulasnella calospora MUT 4182]
MRDAWWLQTSRNSSKVGHHELYLSVNLAARPSEPSDHPTDSIRRIEALPHLEPHPKSESEIRRILRIIRSDRSP